MGRPEREQQRGNAGHYARNNTEPKTLRHDKYSMRSWNEENRIPQFEIADC
jgi:hypothetical protein